MSSVICDQLKMVLEFTRPESTVPRIVNVTSNGEIGYDTHQREFIVYDETYVYVVGQTPYPAVAYMILKTYCDFYLES